MKQSLLLLFILTSFAAYAQDRPFKQLRYDENYEYLKKDTSSNWYHQMKFNPVSKDKNTYFSFGGEVRYQYFYFKNEDWGEAPKDKDGFLLTRYLGNVDFHAGKHFRTFVQLQSSLANGQVETPSPVDNNPLDLHQAFFDLVFPVRDKDNLTIRIGRQELSYGSQRLVAVREGPNNRQSFDAAKVMYRTKQVGLDLFYSHYVQAKTTIFDDASSSSTQFWGAYATFAPVPFFNHIDLYYLGEKKKNAVFDNINGRELRHSVGTRIWNNAEGWQYDVEGLYQFGKFNTETIAAWTLSSHVCYTFNSTPLTPELGLKAELVSGDKSHNDQRLNTFNPLFPKGAYFGLAALIGPSNLIDTHPYIMITLAKNLTLTEDYDMFWRMDRNDGLYAPNGKVIYPGQNNFSKQIGSQLATYLEYTPNNFLYFRGEFTWFKAGDYLKESGPGKDILLAGTTITLKF